MAINAPKPGEKYLGNTTGRTWECIKVIAEKGKDTRYQFSDVDNGQLITVHMSSVINRMERVYE